MAIPTWTVCSLDVWGNERDGYEVNNIFRTEFDDLYISEDTTDKEIIQFLKRIGYLKKTCKDSKFDIDGDDMFMYIDYCGQPVCHLVRNDE